MNVNHTMFNNCVGDKEPCWGAFESLHIGPCRSGDGETIPLEPGDPETEFWTVYGHTREGDGLALTDVSTEHLAGQVMARMVTLAAAVGVHLETD